MCIFIRTLNRGAMPVRIRGDRLLAFKEARPMMTLPFFFASFLLIHMQFCVIINRRTCKRRCRIPVAHTAGGHSSRNNQPCALESVSRTGSQTLGRKSIPGMCFCKRKHTPRMAVLCMIPGFDRPQSLLPADKYERWTAWLYGARADV